MEMGTLSQTSIRIHHAVLHQMKRRVSYTAQNVSQTFQGWKSLGVMSLASVKWFQDELLVAVSI
eukprot:2898840-Ditylum_brightwellii.AAC.1